MQNLPPDMNKMNISELIRFAETQAERERQNPSDEDDSLRTASWAQTLSVLRFMKEHGVPESLKD